MARKLTIWAARDGKEFNSREDCDAYEAALGPECPVMWDADRIAAVDAGQTDEAKADGKLIENWAAKLREDRSARGEIRRRKVEPVTE